MTKRRIHWGLVEHSHSDKCGISGAHSGKTCGITLAYPLSVTCANCNGVTVAVDSLEIDGSYYCSCCYISFCDSANQEG